MSGALLLLGGGGTHCVVCSFLFVVGVVAVPCGDRTHTAIEENDIIHVILHPKPPAHAPASTTSGGRIVVDRWKNALVVLPDVLVSPTRVTDSLGCARRGVIGELVNEGGTSRPALMGQVRVRVWVCVCSAARVRSLTIVILVPCCSQLKHALFEQAMLAGNFRGKFLADTALSIVRQPSTMQVRCRTGPVATWARIHTDASRLTAHVRPHRVLPRSRCTPLVPGRTRRWGNCAT